MNHCQANTLHGERCQAPASSSGFCYFHDSSRAVEREAARRLGGKHRRRLPSSLPFPDGIDTNTVKGLAQLLSVVIRETWGLEGSVARSRTMGYLIATQKVVLESSDLEQRIEALERATGVKP